MNDIIYYWEVMGRRKIIWKQTMTKVQYRTFLFWGVCSSLGVTVSTLVDATLVGNFIGSTGLAVANIATPVFLLYLLMGITLGGRCRRLNWEKTW